MLHARMIVIVIGILLPYADGEMIAAMRHGTPGEWVKSILFFGGFNAIAWGSVLLVSGVYRHAASVWFPAIFCFIPLGLMYALHGLFSDAQAAIGLVFIPIYALPCVLVGGLCGFICDRLIERRRPRANPGLAL